jgi:hypothetical protein
MAPLNKVSTSSMRMSFANGLVGSDVEAPMFDPLSLSADASEETINWYRAAELKVRLATHTRVSRIPYLSHYLTSLPAHLHTCTLAYSGMIHFLPFLHTQHCRICMLAALGLSVQPVFHLPDAVFDSTAGFGVVTKLYAERPEAIWQILTALAAIETFSLFRDGQGEAGDLNFDPLNLQEKLGLNADKSKMKEMQLRELKNGRLAMLGTSALLIQEYVTGYGPYEQLMPHV